MASFRKYVESLGRPPQETRAANLCEWVRSIEGAIPIGQVEPRTRVKVAGVVHNIRIDPRQGRGAIEATIVDGSGEMIARWTGRRSLSGVRLAKGLVMEGIPGRSDDGTLVILNPDYSLVSSPEHG